MELEYFKRLFKGVFALFVVNLTIALGVLFVQSCQKEIGVFQDTEKQMALQKFENLVRKSSSDIQSLADRYPQIELVPKSASSEGSNAQAEKEAQDALLPLVHGTKELLKHYEIDENALVEDFEDLNNPRIALVGLAVLAAESKQGNEIASTFLSIFVETAYANETWDCAARALGIPTAMIAGGMKNMTVKAMMKSASKLAGRTLGWVGLAFAVADFTSCMGYW